MSTQRDRSRPSAPAITYTALTLVLVVLVASLAFNARQAPPPQIAEFAPQVQKQINRAPHQLSGSIGAAQGGQAGAGGSTGVAPSTTTRGSPASSPAGTAAVYLPAVHHCIGNPPRQIEDTQSPPCVAYWAGDNGGATSRGVTRTDIVVAVSENSSSSSATDQRVYGDLQTFFNDFFEFYGRQIRLVPYAAGTGGTCAAAQAKADGIFQQDDPFAGTGESGASSSECFVGELARRGVVEVSTNPWFSSSTMAGASPYVWEYAMAWDNQLATTGAFICSQLAGRKATYSPDPLLSSQTRRFGLILMFDQSPYPESPKPLTSALAACGASPVVTRVYADPNNGSSPESWDANTLLDMKQAGVTTVVCACSYDNLDETYLPADADSEDYHPEWILPSMATSNQFSSDIRLFWPQADQRVALFGLNFEPASVPYPDATLNWALDAVDPGYQINSSGPYDDYQQVYWQLLLIASGIQMAGPDLTPYSFQAGLQAAHFPNPYSPEMEGVAGFGGGSHSMTTDAAIMWWSNSGVSPHLDNGAGSWCYADGARRFTAAALDATNSALLPAKLATAPCSSAPPGT